MKLFHDILAAKMAATYTFITLQTKACAGEYNFRIIEYNLKYIHTRDFVFDTR